MLAPVPRKRKDGGSSFKRLGEYILYEADEKEPVLRGDVMLSDNLLSLETAAAEMRAVAAENPRVKDPVLHLVLAWQPGETPSREQWERAVKHVMAEVELKSHQYLAVAHTDTEAFHVHVMANRVHPETYLAHYPDWLHKSLDKACREIEAAQGWRHSNGLYRWDEERGQAVPLTRAERDALRERVEARGLDAGEAGKGRAASMERFGNAESLQTYCKGAPAQDLARLMERERVTWQDVHATLARHGLTLKPGEKGGYAVDAEGVKVKASDVFRRQFSGKATRAATEARLGPWEAPGAPLAVPARQTYSPHREPRRNPSERAERRDARAAAREALKARFRDYKRAYRDERGRRGPADQAEARARHLALRREVREHRAAIRLAGYGPAERKAMLSLAAVEAVQAKESLRRDLATRRRADRPLTYRDWVAARAEEGDVAALAQVRGWRYSDRRRRDEAPGRNSVQGVDGGGVDPADPRRAPALAGLTWRVDLRTGDVRYQVDGRQAFTDRGRDLRVEAEDRRAMEAALRLAQEKFGGSLSLYGSLDYQRRMVDTAADAGIRVDFNDSALNARYAERREAIRTRDTGLAATSGRQVEASRTTRRNERDIER